MVPAWSKPMTAEAQHLVVHPKGEHCAAGLTLAKFAADFRGLLSCMAQALIELATTRVGNRAILEGIRNHQTAQGAAASRPEALLSE